MKQRPVKQRPVIDLELHRRWRAVLRGHQNRVVGTLARPVMRGVAIEFGLLEGDTLLLETNDELTILFDHLIYDRPQQGKTAVERYVAGLPATDDAHERIVREAMLGQRYSVFEIELAHKGTGVVMRDLLRDESLLSVDEALSATAKKGMLMAYRVLPVPGYWMPSGGGFPISEEAVQIVLDTFEPKVKRNPHGTATLSRQDEQRLAAVVVGEGFDEGSTALIGYR